MKHRVFDGSVQEDDVDSFAKARSLSQGITVIVVCCIGILGFAAQIAEGNIPLAVMFGIVTPLGFALGIWLIRRPFTGGGDASGSEPSPEHHRADA